jgi:hypothetical protein
VGILIIPRSTEKDKGMNNMSTKTVADAVNELDLLETHLDMIANTADIILDNMWEDAHNATCNALARNFVERFSSYHSALTLLFLNLRNLQEEARTAVDGYFEQCNVDNHNSIAISKTGRNTQ